MLLCYPFQRKPLCVSVFRTWKTPRETVGLSRGVGETLTAVDGIERERACCLGALEVLAGLQVTTVTLLWKWEGAPKKLS